MPRDSQGSTTIYNVHGDNARWNINTTDNSVNIVTKSTQEFLTTPHEQIESGVATEKDRQKILQALSALEQSHGQKSFAQHYTDFIAAAANHMTVILVILPFIPALTEMVHHALK